jgi:large subunit ribosomal protein L13
MTTTLSRTNDVEERWLLYDASEHVLGHMASQIAMNLMGKDRPQYTPNHCTGAFVVVVNADKINLTGKKTDVKRYVHYTGYQGGQRSIPLERVLERRPTDVVRLAVRRMLPKTTLGRDMLRRLRIYTGTDHPHAAQKPEHVAPVTKQAKQQAKKKTKS